MALARPAGYTPEHFRLTVADRVASITLDRPERKNPLTFESYAELARVLRETSPRAWRACGGDRRSGRQLLLRRRRARDHRPAGADAAGGRHARAARFHPHDRRCGEGDARLPAADHRRNRRRVRRRRRDPGDGVGPAARHRAQQGRFPVRACRACRCRHGRMQHPAAHHRRRSRRRVALHRPQHGRRRGGTLGLLQPALRARDGAD